MTPRALPHVPGVLTPEAARASGESIARLQHSSGAIPWSEDGHTDPWDHLESAMGLTVAGLDDEARTAFEFSRRTQRDDGSWPLRWQGEVIEDANSDTNFCAYVAVGVWHFVRVTGDEAFAETMWPTVERAIDFVLRFQTVRGDVVWAAGPSVVGVDSLVTGNSSIHHSLQCAIALAEHRGVHRPDWELALDRLAHALTVHPEVFADHDEYSMDWYYPILGGALRGREADARLRSRWDDFVVPGLGIRCVDHRPWVTGAETCELVMALAAVGRIDDAREQFAAMQHLRETDGSYWTGLVFSDGKRWPVERTTWTTGAMLLAADAIDGATAGAAVFRGDELPAPHGVPCGPECTALLSRPSTT